MCECMYEGMYKYSLGLQSDNCVEPAGHVLDQWHLLQLFDLGAN